MGNRKLNQDEMTPLYVQLMSEIEKDINSGIYKPETDHDRV